MNIPGIGDFRIARSTKSIRPRPMTETIHRQCSVCETELEIQIEESGEYDNGHYFGGLHSGHEYWECDPCWNGGN